MKRPQRQSIALVSAGTFASAFSKWYLIWLFARAGGGAARVGEYSTVIAFATPLFVVAQLGLRIIFVSAEKLWPWKTYSTLRCFGLLFGSAALVGYLLIGSRVPLAIGFAVLALKVAEAILDLESARIQFHNRMSAVGLIMIFSSVGAIAMTTISVLLFQSVSAGVLGGALATLGAGMCARSFGRRLPYVPSVSGSGYRTILTASLPITVAQWLASLLSYVPILLMGAFADRSEVGIYAGAAYLLTASNLVGSTLQKLLMTPFRITRRTRGDSALLKRTVRVSGWVLAVGSGGGIVVVLLGSRVVEALYGPMFGLGWVPLLLLSVAAVSSIVAYVLSVGLNVLNRYGGVTFSMVASVSVALLVGSSLFFAGCDPVVSASATAASGGVARMVSMWQMLMRGRRRS